MTYYNVESEWLSKLLDGNSIELKEVKVDISKLQQEYIYNIKSLNKHKHHLTQREEDIKLAIIKNNKDKEEI